MSHKPTENRTRKPKGDVLANNINKYIPCTNKILIKIITIIIYFFTILT